MARQPLTEKVADDIIQLIRQSKMRPGERLANEYELAQKLNVGRGSLREAIKILISRNILFVKQGSGTFVSAGQGIPTDPLGLTFVENRVKMATDLIEIRLMVEPEIAAMAAANAGPVDSEKIYRAAELVEHLIGEGEEYSQADVDFHRKVAEASGNMVITSLIPIIHTEEALAEVNQSPGFVENVRKYHKIIADSIAFGEIKDAKYAMFMHLNLLREALLERFIGEREQRAPNM